MARTLSFVFLFLTAGQFVFAADVPIGKFDCSKRGMTYLITISEAAGTYHLAVEHETTKDHTVLHGYGTVASYRAKDGKAFDLIRLPGSTVELYFDDSGRLGVDRSDLNCKRLP